MERIDLQIMVSGVAYNAVISVKETLNGKDYLIQVASDSAASPILFDQMIIKESGGHLHVDQERNEIKLKIASTLSARLKMPCFVSDKYLLKPDADSQNWMNFHPIARKQAHLR